MTRNSDVKVLPNSVLHVLTRRLPTCCVSVVELNAHKAMLQVKRKDLLQEFTHHSLVQIILARLFERAQQRIGMQREAYDVRLAHLA